MTVAPGARLGPYEITGGLGAGGMGEVYRARDTTLNRQVAIKVLPAALASNAERLARFKREAQVLASLNHPNIAQVYGFEAAPLADGSTAHFLAMELIEGEDLAARLKRGAIPADEAIAIARQIAEGLEEAHERGVIHRDLKPANVIVTPEGKVKVLDFGLAKALEEDAAAGSGGGGGELSHSPTMTGQGTVAGMILGTAAYMSPEQARGKKVDKRADIWSFGVVLFEMLSGRRLFEGETVSDVLAAVLKTEPDWSALPRATPAGLVRLLRRCLDRNPKNRLHDIAEARLALDEIASGAREPETPASTNGFSRRSAGLALAGALVLGVLLGRGWAARGGAGDAPALRGQFEIAAPEKTDFVSGLAISADGRQLAFVARGEDGRTRLWTRPIDSTGAKALPGSVDARYPFWAPDGRRLGFFSQNRLRVTDLLGGQPREIAVTGSGDDVRGAAWGADDRIVFTPTFTGPLFSVAASGGEAVPATEIRDGLGTQRFPSFLPDGRRFVFFASPGTGVEPGTLYLGRLGSLASKKLGPVTSSALYAEPGHLIYVQGDSLVAHRFDGEREELVGQPIPLGVSLPGSVSVSGQRSLSLARNGILVYRTDKRSASRLVWVDRQGRELGAVQSEVETWFYAPALSPDGRHLAVSHYEAGSTSGGIWIHDLERKLASRLTIDNKSDDSTVAWSPDGRQVAYASMSSAGNGIYRSTLREQGQAKLWVPSDTFAWPSVWLADGRLIYIALTKSGRNNLFLLGASGSARRLGPEQVSELGADLSPDGHWLAFQADPTRRMEIYMRRLDDATGASTIRLSLEGGTTPRFRRDGRELFYLEDSGRMMSVPMKGLDPPQPGVPVPLFDARIERGADRQFDVALDGQRFILNRSLVADRIPIAVLLGWQERLRQAPAPADAR